MGMDWNLQDFLEEDLQEENFLIHLIQYYSLLHHQNHPKVLLVHYENLLHHLLMLLLKMLKLNQYLQYLHLRYPHLHHLL
jgi:hypothetical protein